jgi:predicted ATPase
MSVTKTRITITVDHRLAAYAEEQVEAGKAESVSAVFNSAMAGQIERDRRIMRRFREIAAQADPEKVARMMAHLKAQEALLPERYRRPRG